MNKLRINITQAVFCLLAFYCLAFGTKDEPPPTPTPPTVGHRAYKLNKDEIAEMATLWLNAHNLPITGKIDIYAESYSTFSASWASSNGSSGQSGTIKEASIKVEYHP